MSRADRAASRLNLVVVVLATLATLGVSSELATRHPVRWDLTEEGAATLDADTLAVLALAEERDVAVSLTAFSSQARDEEALVRDRLLRDHLSLLEGVSERVTTRFVDFDRERWSAERLGVDRYGTVVVEAGGRRVDVDERDLFSTQGRRGARDVSFVGEPALASAVRRVVAGRQKVLYLLSGHGEVPIFDRGLGELHGLADRVDEQGWAVRGLSLADGLPEVPSDAAAVVVLGPAAALSEPEEAALRSFLASGGSLGWFVDPGAPPSALLGELGVEPVPGFAMDPASQLPHLDRPLLRYGRHPITEALVEEDLSTVVSAAAAWKVRPLDGVRVSILLQTGPRGWIERGAEPTPAWTEGEDAAGPAIVALALDVAAPHPVMAAGRSGRVVVVGDVDLVRDELMEQAAGNGTFVTNSLRWLIEPDPRLTRVGRPVRTRRLAVDEHQLDAIRWALVGGMPLLAALGGLATWWARRGR